jgi:hypothetical protein
VAILVVTSVSALLLTPFLVVVGSNVGRLPIPTVVLVRSIAVVVGLVAGSSWLMHRLMPRTPADTPLWIAGLLGSLAVTSTAVALRPAITATRAPAAAHAAADRIVNDILHAPSQPPPHPQRDIYVIVLDMMASPAVLQAHYALDVSDVVGALRARGLTVPLAARSHYSQTFLSLASLLNASYLEELVDEIDPSVQDVYPLKDLIDRGALLQLARRAGYRVVVLGSAYASTESVAGADICRCAPLVPHQAEYAAMTRIPGLAAMLPVNRWAHDALRRKIRTTLADITAVRYSPQLVFAHVSAPHPPFVVTAGGAPRDPRSRFTFIGPQDATDYANGYREQARFVLNSITGIVGTLLGRPGPAPVLIILGDHGPPARVSSASSDHESLLGIFVAYSLPGVDLPDTASPINLARLVASHYLGVVLEPVPDRYWVAKTYHPYDLERVSP